MDLRCLRHIGGMAALMALLAVPATAQTVRSGTGMDPAGITPVIDQFRADLGGADNGSGPGGQAGGRREINWDDVPWNLSSPNTLPGDYYNSTDAPRARGALFTTTGSGFAVSASAGQVLFRDINGSYRFQAYSPEKIFTPLGRNITDVRFTVPGSPDKGALTTGFGAVFTDVDRATSTTLEFFDGTDTSLGSFYAPAGAARDRSLSFLGVSFGAPTVSRVRIKTGTNALDPAVLEGDNRPNIVIGADVVAMDDLIFGEPQAPGGAIPEPATLTLWAFAGATLLARRLRRIA